VEDCVRFRIEDVVDAIDQAEQLLANRTYDDLQADRVSRAAYERFLEIVSEGSRHIPTAIKAAYPEAPWRDIAALGNVLRHAYFNLDDVTLWDIYDKGQLHELRRILRQILDTPPGDT
jgi:uncharacterized protein with HEPN domain